MSDSKDDLPPELEGVDWDAALDEWEQNAFAPEVATDTETLKRADLVAPPTKSVPPPAVAAKPVASADATVDVPAIGTPTPLVPPPPAAGPRISRPPQESSIDVSEMAESLDGESESDAALRSGGALSTGSVAAYVELDDEPPPSVTKARPLLAAETASLAEAIERARSIPVPEVGPSSLDVAARLGELTDRDSVISVETAAAPKAASLPSIPKAPSAREFDAHEEVTSHGGALRGAEAIHVPESRRFDPNEDTSVRSLAALRAASLRAERDSASGKDDLADTSTRPRGKVGGVPEGERRWDDEKRAALHLDEAALTSLVARAEWFEAEARVRPNPEAIARGLVVASEMRAMAGDVETAKALAREARGHSDDPFVTRHLRSLHDLASETDDVVELLDDEASRVAVESARIHAKLLAADVARVHGGSKDVDGIWERIFLEHPGDIRAAVGRAARALAASETTSLALTMPEVPSFTPVANVVATALRLRGIGAGDDRDPKLARNLDMAAARTAFAARDTDDASTAFARLAELDELHGAATWAQAMLVGAREESRADLRAPLAELARRGDKDAARTLATRALEVRDTPLLRESMMLGAGDSDAERGILLALAGETGLPLETLLDVASEEGLRPLAAALGSLLPRQGLARSSAEGPNLEAFAALGAGDDGTRIATRLARLLAWGGKPSAVTSAATSYVPRDATLARVLGCDLFDTADAVASLSSLLEEWPIRDTDGEDKDRALAVGIVHELRHDAVAAVHAYDAALALDANDAVAIRAIQTNSREREIEVLEEAADASEGLPGALWLLEALARSPELAPGTTLPNFEAAHDKSPTFPVPAFLAELAAENSGQFEEAVRWLEVSRARATDPTERAILATRAAYLLREGDPDAFARYLGEALQSRPDDVGLWETNSQLGTTSAEARARFLEKRAAASGGSEREAYTLRAAYEYLAARDPESARRVASEFFGDARPNDSLLAIVSERAERESGNVSRIADELLAAAKAAESADDRREAYERLAELDRTARNDAASALLWHRTILEELPHSKPSLRHVERTYVRDGRIDELEPIATAIAEALRGEDGGECVAHVELATRLAQKRGATDRELHVLTELGAEQKETARATIRRRYALARGSADASELIASIATLERLTHRDEEIATLALRRAEAAARTTHRSDLLVALDVANERLPGDLVVARVRAELLRRHGDPAAAAAAFEALGNLVRVPRHRAFAMYRAATLWLDGTGDEAKGIPDLEAVSGIDLHFRDTFDRLSALYTKHGRTKELADLLTRRLEGVEASEERVRLQVELARTLLAVGGLEEAEAALEAALAAKPEQPDALFVLADVAVRRQHWTKAEAALLQLGRLAPSPEEQVRVYLELGDLYSEHLDNLDRAELSYREVLKRLPGDVTAIERLVGVFRRKGDAKRAIETQQELVQHAPNPEVKRARLVLLATLFEETAKDNRKAEQTLEAARREFPSDTTILRAFVEFYRRHKQTPAAQVLMDRSVADARRTFAAGRLTPALLEVVATVHDLRGKKDGARAALAARAAFEGQPTDLVGAGARAGDPRFDDLLAPEAVSPALRSLLRRTGDALDATLPFDPKSKGGAPLAASTSEARRIHVIAETMKVQPPELYVTRAIQGVVPVVSSPPTLLIGETVLASPNDALFTYSVVRGLKLTQAKASALARSKPEDSALLLFGLLRTLEKNFKPEGVKEDALAAMARKVAAALPKATDADTLTVALEVMGALGKDMANIGAHLVAWANHAALLAVGDPNVAIEAIAVSIGMPKGAPSTPKERGLWISKTPEVKEMLAFGAGDAYAEARVQLGLANVGGSGFPKPPG
ncbi:MAG: tetratricopeptide repeat protein [Polyangiaceae bacterium]